MPVFYTASTEVIPNPERGYFYYTETHYHFDGTGHVALNASTLASARTGTATYNGIDFTGRTIVFRYYYIEKYKTVAMIDPAYLNLLAADLAMVRTAGCKIILRFAYYNQQDSDSDATPAYVRGHIQQLAPILNQYADIIHAVEAGFIGAWGEWYYTNNFGDQGNVSSQNITDRNSVIDALLTNLDPNIFVLLRYIGTRQAYLNSIAPNPGGNALRLGHHNDAFLAGYANFGTYTTFSSQTESFNRLYLDAITNIPVGGESANYNPPDSDWTNASTELATHKFSFLNPNYYAQTVQNWGQANNDTVSRKLGYRIRMISSSIPGTMTGGSQASFQVVVVNDGWLPPVRNRPVYLVLDDGNGHNATCTLSTDIRSWTPGTQITLNGTITAPTTSAVYNSFLTLPDPSSAIANNPLYMIQTANVGTWNATTGRNALNSPVTVTGSNGTQTPATKNIFKLTQNGTTRTVKLI